MTRRWILALAVIALPMCKRDEPTKPPPADDGSAPADTTPPSDEVAKAPAGGEAPAETANEVGVPECDNYLRVFRRCVNEQVPAESRADMLRAIDDSAGAWKEAAAGPKRNELAAACTSALESAKEALGPMGCSFD